MVSKQTDPISTGEKGKLVKGGDLQSTLRIELCKYERTLHEAEILARFVGSGEGKTAEESSQITFKYFILVLEIVLSRIAVGNTFTSWKDHFVTGE